MNIKNPMPSVRVRFAPSPTGHLHIGGLRAALFNWLFARHNKGAYLLRIEDTDTQRSKQEYTDAILAACAWTHIVADEPPLIQSTRQAEHKALAELLITQGKAYRCYCPQSQQSDNDTVSYKKYDGTCRMRTTSDATLPHVIRFKIMTQQPIVWHDLIRGPISFEVDELDDFIIVRTDGTPMYNFVVVADDAFMRITHVIRGEEHISNTPKQILLYQACDVALPYFAHLPVILNASGQKLSKRDGATAVIDYKSMGYLPDALINYLVRLGWSHGDQEIFTRQELIDLFSLEQVGKKGAIFDGAKLLWMNSVYMRAMDNRALYTYMIANVAPNLEIILASWPEQQIVDIVALYKERTNTLRELADELILVVRGPQQINREELAQYVHTGTTVLLHELIQMLEAKDTFKVDLLTDAIKALCKEQNIKLVQLAQPIRLALVGKTASPGIFELLAFLGKQESIRRLNAFVQIIK